MSQKKEDKGIPIDNKNVSKDPNKSPQGSDKDDYKDPHHEDYVEPYNKQKYHRDSKKKKQN